MPRKWDPPDAVHWTERYLAGESEYRLAAEAGISTGAFKRFLERNGIVRRSCREANTARMARMSREERRACTAAAHAASWGRVAPEDELIRRAKTRERTGFGIGRWEKTVTAELTSRGLKVKPQLAIGRYNIDIAAWPLAVEIHSGAGYPHASRYGERIKYLADRGWLSVYVTFNHGRFCVPVVCDQVITLLDLAKQQPPTPGQYWVIRGSSQIPVTIEAQLD